MPVTVESNFVSRMTAGYGHAVLRVTHDGGDDAVWSAVDEAIRGLEATYPGLVTLSLRTPFGPYVWFDPLRTKKPQARAISEAFGKALNRPGIDIAVVECPPFGGPLTNYWGLPRRPRAVCARVYPPPAADGRPAPRIPLSWLDAASRWLRDRLSDDADLRANVILHEFPLPVADVPLVLDRCQRWHAFVVTGAPVPIVSSVATWPPRGWSGARIDSYADEVLGARLRGAGIYGGALRRVPHLKLAGGGPGSSDDELLDLFHSMRELVRGLAGEVAYAFVSVEPTFAALTAMETPTEWSTLGGARADYLLEQACDRRVFDAFPYQVIGPGHVERLGRVPSGAMPTTNGRFELAVGDPSEWLFTSQTDSAASPREDVSSRRRRPDLPSSGRRLLSECLVTNGESP